MAFPPIGGSSEKSLMAFPAALFPCFLFEGMEMARHKPNLALDANGISRGSQSWRGGHLTEPASVLVQTCWSRPTLDPIGFFNKNEAKPSEFTI
jgi:hypothetical protein